MSYNGQIMPGEHFFVYEVDTTKLGRPTSVETNPLSRHFWPH